MSRPEGLSYLLGWKCKWKDPSHRSCERSEQHSWHGYPDVLSVLLHCAPPLNQYPLARPSYKDESAPTQAPALYSKSGGGCVSTPRGSFVSRRRSEEHTSELQSLRHLV